MKIMLVGLGKMGTAIVERLLSTGHEVKIYNRTSSKMLPLVKLGAIPSDSLEAVKQADFILTSLLDDNAVKTVTQQMLPFLSQNSIHVGLSTILPDTALEIAKSHQNQGSHYISAVVLGIPKVAKRGELTTFCAGREGDIERILPLLNAFSHTVIPMGNHFHYPCIMKICMNYSLITAIELISELYVFAEKSGFDKALVRMGLHEIYGHPAFKQYVDKIYERTFDEVNFDMAGGNKDVLLFQEAFAKVGVAPELANVARSRIISALAQGKENKDWSGVYEMIRHQSGLNN